MSSTLGEIVEAWLRLETVADRHLAILAVIEEEREEAAQEQAERDELAQLERNVNAAKSAVIRFHQDKSDREEFALIVEGLEEWNRGAFHAYVSYQGKEYATDFDDAYIGEWPTLVEYAEQFAEDVEAVPAGSLAERYFDAAAFANDLEVSGDLFTVPAPAGSVYVFNSY